MTSCLLRRLVRRLQEDDCKMFFPNRLKILLLSPHPTGSQSCHIMLDGINCCTVWESDNYTTKRSDLVVCLSTLQCIFTKTPLPKKQNKKTIQYKSNFFLRQVNVGQLLCTSCYCICFKMTIYKKNNLQLSQVLWTKVHRTDGNS